MPLTTSRVMMVGVAAMAALAWIAMQSSGQSKAVVKDHAGAVDNSTARHKQVAAEVKPEVRVPVKGHAPQPVPVLTADTRRLQPAHEELDRPPMPVASGKPAVIATRDLLGFDSLSEGRQKLVATAIAVARNSPWLPYTYGGADPALGGLDCSGAMFFVMSQIGLNPPRTSAGQYLWLRDHLRLHLIPDEASTTDHLSWTWLLPGDLLFWATTPPTPDDAHGAVITHVAMYLGREKSDGWQVMINSTDNRSYRGTRANGYGVYDFSMPREGAATRIVAYGPPPGIADIRTPDPASP